jgi:hypothetical protein
VHIGGTPEQSAHELGEQAYEAPHEAQLVAVPTQPVADQEHPLSAEHEVDDVFATHGVTDPAQDEFQLQPYSAEHAVDVAFAPHGVTVPMHVPGFQLQPYWDEQEVDEVIEAHGVRDSVQVDDQAQPALPQRLDEA